MCSRNCKEMSFLSAMVFRATGVLNGWEAEKCLQFGWASGVLAASSLNDYAEPADEKQVWDIYRGNARVQR